MLGAPRASVIERQDLPLCKQEEAVLASGALCEVVYFRCSIYLFHALELHSTQVCPTPACCLPDPREGTLPPSSRKELGWVEILLPGRSDRFKPILRYHSLPDIINFTLLKKHCGLLQCTVFSPSQLFQRAVEGIVSEKDSLGQKLDFCTCFPNSGEVNPGPHAVTCRRSAAERTLALPPVCMCQFSCVG